MQHKKYIGYEISQTAFELCKTKSKDNVTFFHKDLLKVQDVYFDVAMAIDVFEHVEDYLGFLKKLKSKAEYKIFRIPLDLSVQTVLRSSTQNHTHIIVLPTKINIGKCTLGSVGCSRCHRHWSCLDPTQQCRHSS